MNNIDIVGVGSRTQNLSTTKQLESLDYYLALTKKLISKYGGNWSRQMLSNEDCIANFANKLMMADIQFNGKGEIHGYRKQRFLWALAVYFKRMKKNRQFNILSLDQDIKHHKSSSVNNLSTLIASENLSPPNQLIRKESKIEVAKILENTLLTDQQKTYLKMYFGIDPFTENMTMDAIAKHHGVSKNNVFLILHRSIDLLKEYYNEK